MLIFTLVVAAAFAWWGNYWQGVMDSKTEAEPLVLGTLSWQIPSPLGDVQFHFVSPGGEKRTAFQSLEGKKIGPETYLQIEAQTEFSRELEATFQVQNPTGWRRIGEATISGTNGFPVVVGVYLTPKPSLGFGRNGSYYMPIAPSSQLVEFFSSQQQNPK